MLNNNLLCVETVCKDAQVPYEVRDWNALPPFHGTLYADLLAYAPYEVDEAGKITAFTPQVVMIRDYDKILFDRYRSRLVAGFKEE